MKSKTQYVFLIFVGLTAYLLVSRYIAGEGKRAKVGRPVLEQAAVIDRIVIKKYLHGQTNLVRMGSQWFVNDQVLVPADQAKVERMLQKLSETQVVEKVSDHLQTEPEYEINQHSVVGEFYQGSSRKLRLQLGAPKGKEEQYVALTDVKACYVVSRHILLDPSQANWEVTTLEQLLPSKISRVGSTSRYLSPKRKDLVLSELTTMQLLKRVPASTVEKAASQPVLSLVVGMSNGLTIDLGFLEFKDTYYMAINAHDLSHEDVKYAEEELGEEKTSSEQVKQEWQWLRALGDVSIFEVPSYAVERLYK